MTYRTEAAATGADVRIWNVKQVLIDFLAVHILIRVLLNESTWQKA